MRARLFTLIAIFVIAGFGTTAFAQDNIRNDPPAASHKASNKAKSKKRKKRKVRRVSPQQLRRMTSAFKASSDLKVMARQLIDLRSPAAYSGVENYARAHRGTDAGALASLALAYAHILDKDFAKALPDLALARTNAGELSDYVSYLQALAYAGMNDNAHVIETLRSFEQNQPDSIFRADVVPVYGNALAGNGQARQAIAYLEAHRQPTRASVELALGRAYIKANNSAKGVEILRHIYFTMPNSAEAAQAADDLKAQGSTLAGTPAEHRQRAQLLEKASRWSDAVAEYRVVLGQVSETEVAGVQVQLAADLRRSSDLREARRLLEGTQSTGDVEAQRLYNLLELARNDDNESALVECLNRLRQAGPATPAMESALISTANYYLLRKDYDKSIQFFRELQQRFPGGSRGSYSHWRAAWLSYRQGMIDQARRAFEDQITFYPGGSEVPAALYWRARIAEDDGDFALARILYAKLNTRFRNYYYGVLARQRFATLPADASSQPARQQFDSVLQRIPPPIQVDDDARVTDVPENELRVEKSRLLANAGLTEYAARELEAAGGGSGPNWATLQVARVYQEAGLYSRALEYLKKSIPGYYSLDVSALPRPYWEALFPRAYWTDLRRFSQANELDPYLVAALIRQESEFNPQAISHANAWGLMQLLPINGRAEAKEAKLHGFSTGQLLQPGVNLQLGTHFFKKTLDEYSGQVEYALAAYNAGSNRVADWRATGKYRDMAEFVESIPFTETRDYVQAIVRNTQVYRQLYPAGEPPAPSVAGTETTPTAAKE